LYIVGVTWFARTEAKTSSQTALAGAACVMLASLLLGLTVASQKPVDTVSPLFPFLLVALGFWLGFPLYRAINSPTPTNVQSGVKRSLIGLILLDAALASGTAGTIGLILLVLNVVCDMNVQKARGEWASAHRTTAVNKRVKRGWVSMRDTDNGGQ
jgi:4-hydroxybenzoate polyprenyltransferase